MRAIFLKEWRQGHLLPWAGLLLSALTVVLYALWATCYATTPQDVDDLARYCVLLMRIGLGVMLLVSASGLIAAETSTGAITYLLGLPISRSRMWWGKVFAGLGLTAATAVLLIAPASLVLPGIREHGHFLLYLPDMVAGMLCVFAVGMFCSTIFDRPLTVFIVAPLIILGLAFVPASLIHDHRVLLGYDKGMADASLWALVLAPPFFLASWLAFTRGELLDSRRRWWHAFPVLAGGLAVVVLGMLAATDRELPPYLQRSDVAGVSQVTLSSGSNYAAVVVHGSRAAFSRSAEEGWTRGGKTRITNTVLVDLETGGDVMWWLGERVVAVSPDGRLVATGGPAGRSWGGLQVQQVPSRRLVFELKTLFLVEGSRGTGQDRAGTWSGDGKWLACFSYQDLQPARTSAGPGNWRRQQKLLVVRADGGVRREVLLCEQEQIPGTDQGGQPQMRPISPEFISSWQWVPGEEALYLLNDSGELSRYSPADGTRTVLWRPSGAFAPREDWMRREMHLGISQDGKRIAMRAPEAAPDEQHAAGSRTWVVAVEHGRIRQLAEFTDAETGRVPAVWAGDNRTLYLGMNLRWEEGQAQPTRVRESESAIWRSTAALLPFGSGVLYSINGSVDNAYFVDANHRFHLLREAYPKLNRGTIVALDAQGRLVIKDGIEVAALDPKTGAVSRLYP